MDDTGKHVESLQESRASVPPTASCERVVEIEGRVVEGLLPKEGSEGGCVFNAVRDIHAPERETVRKECVEDRYLGLGKGIFQRNDGYSRASRKDMLAADERKSQRRLRNFLIKIPDRTDVLK